jgi:hypothetical protein
MTQSQVTTLNQVVEIDSVDSIVMTAPVDDGTSTGTFVRAIRVFGEPNGVNGPPILEVRVKSTTVGNIEVVTPNLTF